MLTTLKIDNYALIEKSEVDFSSGFTVITGETGAGKSIMLDALSLIMGARADIKAIGEKNKKLVVEAFFSSPDPTLKQILEKNDIDWDADEISVRREISPAGKSRGFINDSPANLALLSEVSTKLIDIHSQHSNNVLTDVKSQTEMLDIYAEDQEELKAYKELFADYLDLRGKIKKKRESRKEKKENREFVIFRLDQLDKLKPKKGELNHLEKEFELLSDADRIQSELGEAYELLDGNGSSALKLLKAAAACVGRIDLSLLENQQEDVISRLESIKIDLRDVSDTISGYLEKVASDPGRLEKTKERIEKIEEAIRHFKVRDEEELVALHEHLKQEINEIDGDDEDLVEEEKKLKGLGVKLKQKADRLSEIRKTAAEVFSRYLVEKLKPLGLPNIRFDIEISYGKLTPEGQDNVIFLCSFNKNHPLQPISEIASGGELARVMLGIKSLMAEKTNLPTVIFDEIDTGVSGEIAHKMGRMMKEMGERMQVLSVTHLPQVAASGTTHYKVYKTDDKEKTISHIKQLDMQERIHEIAAMLSGSVINEVSVNNAKVLLETS